MTNQSSATGGLDMSQKQASKGPMSRCNSDPLHRRPVTKRGPPVLGEKKLGSRISDLESQLEKAQEELKILKGQLNTVKNKRVMNIRKNPSPKGHGIRESKDNEPGTDVFEVPVEELKMDLEQGRRKEEIKLLKTMLEEKEKELQNSHKENEKLKIEMENRLSMVSSAEAKEEEMRTRVSNAIQELEESKGKTDELMAKLEAMEAEKLEMEIEMKKLIIQTDQWRKAAEAAAMVLSEGCGGTETKGRRLLGRWGSMDNKQQHYRNIFENPVGGYNHNHHDDDDDDDIEQNDEEFAGNGRRRSSGIRMLGELWKKKGHK